MLLCRRWTGLHSCSVACQTDLSWLSGASFADGSGTVLKQPLGADCWWNWCQGSPGWRSSRRERQGLLSGSVSCSQQTSLTSAEHTFQLFNVWIDGEHSGRVNFPLPTVSLLSHLQILHLTFNAILPNCPVLYSKSLSFASTCLYRINLFSPAPHSCTQGAPGTRMCGTADFGGSFRDAAGR